MSMPNSVRRRVAAGLAAGCAGLALASAANAVDLRDWGRKFPASQRFVVLSQFNNEAVLDKETQLVWQAVAGPHVSWGLAYLDCLRATTGGRIGWRLPTYPEIASVVVSPGSPQGMSSVFSGVPAGMYWTATENPSNSAAAYRIVLPNGWVNPFTGQLKGNLNRYLCVRGPA